MYCICCPQRFFVFHVHVAMYSSICMYVLSWVSAHGHLNISRDFGPHGHLSGMKISYVYMYIEAARVAP